MRVQQVAKSLGVTTNDLMMAGLFRALGRWGRSHAGISPRALLRLTMPTNLREPEDRRMPAANVMSYAFLDHAQPIAKISPRCQRINVSTCAIRRENLSRQFVEGMRWRRASPGSSRRAPSQHVYVQRRAQQSGRSGEPFSGTSPA